MAAISTDLEKMASMYTNCKVRKHFTEGDFNGTVKRVHLTDDPKDKKKNKIVSSLCIATATVRISTSPK